MELESEDAKLLEAVRLEEVWQALKSIKGSSAPGIFGMLAKVLKWLRA